MKTKNYIRASFVSIAILLCLDIVNQRIYTSYKEIPRADIAKGTEYVVTATMYFPVSSQCDSTPLITADGSKINPTHASEHKWIAMSRDMISRWGGEFNYGDFVQVRGAGHKDGIYRVADTMNKRFKHRIDFLESQGTKRYKFTNVTLTKI